MDFGGGEAVGPPGRARRSHFSLSGELALSGRTGAARAGAAGRTARPVAASTNHLTEADESSLRWPRGPSARSLGPAGSVRSSARWTRCRASTTQSLWAAPCFGGRGRLAFVLRAPGADHAATDQTPRGWRTAPASIHSRVVAPAAADQP